MEDHDIDTPSRGEITTTRTPARALTAEQFHRLADVPAFMVWLANIDTANTRRAYQAQNRTFQFAHTLGNRQVL